MSSRRAPALTPALIFAAFCGPSKCLKRSKKSTFLILKTRFLKSAIRAVLLLRPAQKYERDLCCPVPGKWLRYYYRSLRRKPDIRKRP